MEMDPETSDANVGDGRDAMLPHAVPRHNFSSLANLALAYKEPLGFKRNRKDVFLVLSVPGMGRIVTMNEPLPIRDLEKGSCVPLFMDPRCIDALGRCPPKLFDFGWSEAVKRALYCAIVEKNIHCMCYHENSKRQVKIYYFEDDVWQSTTSLETILRHYHGTMSCSMLESSPAIKDVEDHSAIQLPAVPESSLLRFGYIKETEKIVNKKKKKNRRVSSAVTYRNVELSRVGKRSNLRNDGMGADNYSKWQVEKVKSGKNPVKPCNFLNRASPALVGRGLPMLRRALETGRAVNIFDAIISAGTDRRGPVYFMEQCGSMCRDLNEGDVGELKKMWKDECMPVCSSGLVPKQSNVKEFDIPDHDQTGWIVEYIVPGDMIKEKITVMLFNADWMRDAMCRGVDMPWWSHITAASKNSHCAKVRFPGMMVSGLDDSFITLPACGKEDLPAMSNVLLVISFPRSNDALPMIVSPFVMHGESHEFEPCPVLAAPPPQFFEAHFNSIEVASAAGDLPVKESVTKPTTKPNPTTATTDAAALQRRQPRRKRKRTSTSSSSAPAPSSSSAPEPSSPSAPEPLSSGSPAPSSSSRRGARTRRVRQRRGHTTQTREEIVKENGWLKAELLKKTAALEDVSKCIKEYALNSYVMGHHEVRNKHRSVPGIATCVNAQLSNVKEFIGVLDRHDVFNTSSAQIMDGITHRLRSRDGLDPLCALPVISSDAPDLLRLAAVSAADENDTTAALHQLVNEDLFPTPTRPPKAGQSALSVVNASDDFISQEPGLSPTVFLGPGIPSSFSSSMDLFTPPFSE